MVNKCGLNLILLFIFLSDLFISACRFTLLGILYAWQNTLPLGNQNVFNIFWVEH
jgi:hypothetical protein